MKKALIATDELIKHYQDESVIGYRIVEVANSELWPPAPHHFWIDIDDSFNMDNISLYYYNNQTETVDIILVDPEVVKRMEAAKLNRTQQVINENHKDGQPLTTGTQTI